MTFDYIKIHKKLGLHPEKHILGKTTGEGQIDLFLGLRSHLLDFRFDTRIFSTTSVIYFAFTYYICGFFNLESLDLLPPRKLFFQS